MTVPVFDESLRTGYAAIDDQHQALILLAARVDEKIGICSLDDGEEPSSVSGEGCAERVEDALADAVYGLVDYATEHFTDEEALMAEAGFPQAHVHAALHAELSERLGSYLIKLMDEDPIVASELVEFFTSWLRSHIEREDRAFTDWLARNMNR